MDAALALVSFTHANKASRTGFPAPAAWYNPLRCQTGKRLIQLKQPDAITLTGCLKRILPFLFRQRFIKFSPGMKPSSPLLGSSPAAYGPLVAVRVQPAGEVLGKRMGVLCLPTGLVFIQDNRLFSAAADPVDPHVRLACSGPPRLLQHL